MHTDITCKAAVVWEYGRPLSIETIKVAPPQPHEVRVKVLACGICHTDVMAMDGDLPTMKLPFVVGHEGAGIVESVGAEVTSVKPVSLHNNCADITVNGGSSSGFHDVTKHDLTVAVLGHDPVVPFVRSIGYDGTSRFSHSQTGEPLYHALGSSSFSEYVVIPESSCVKINQSAPLETVCIFSCGFSTGYGASHNLVDVTAEDTVAIWGLGGVGLSTVMGCKDRSAKRIIGIDVNPAKEVIGRQMGCTDFLNPAFDDVEEFLSNVTQREGLDFAFCCGGGVPTIEAAVRSISIQGTIVAVTIPGATEVARLPGAALTARRKITGSLLGGYRVQDDIPKLVDEYMAGKFPLFEQLISHRIPLDQINEGVEMVRTGKCLKTVVLIGLQ